MFELLICTFEDQTTTFGVPAVKLVARGEIVPNLTSAKLTFPTGYTGPATLETNAGAVAPCTVKDARAIPADCPDVFALISA